MKAFTNQPIFNQACARRIWLQRLPYWSSALTLPSVSGLSLAEETSAETSAGSSPPKTRLAKQTHAFDPVQLGRPMIFPRDYGAHLNFRTEWWYVTGVLAPRDGQGERIGFQVTFFRSATGEGKGNPSRFAATQLLFSHAALALRSQGKLIHEQTRMRTGFDQLTSLSELDTDVRSLARSIKREENNPGTSLYKLTVQTPSFSLDLQLSASTPPALQGVQGFSQKSPSIQQASYYYSRPQLQVQGDVTLHVVSGKPNLPSPSQGKNKEGIRPKNYVGQAWMDHEWSNEVLDESAAGWDWMGLNFDDGRSLMAFQIRPKVTGEAVWSEARGFNAQGEVDFLIPAQEQVWVRRQSIRLKPKRLWRSLRSNALYPVELEVELQQPNNTVKRTLALQPLMDDQEVDARASTGGFYWEGLVFVFENQRKIGQGYLELTGYAAPMKL